MPHETIAAMIDEIFADHPSLHDPGSAVALGTLGAPVMLVCENASLTTAQRSGGDPWATSWGDLMLRRTLARAGLDEGRFYLTDVVKSATTGAEWRALGSSGRWEHACWWAPVLAVELTAGPQRVPVTFGARARDLLERMGDVEISTGQLGHRSAFCGAVLRTLPETVVDAVSPHGSPGRRTDRSPRRAKGTGAASDPGGRDARRSASGRRSPTAPTSARTSIPLSVTPPADPTPATR